METYLNSQFWTVDEDFCFAICSYIPPPPHWSHKFITTVTATIRLIICLCIFFQVGVEIRDELQLLASSEVRHDISREVSKKRGMIDTIWALAAIFPYSTSFSKSHVRTTFNLSFPNKQHIIVLTTVYSIKVMFKISSFTCNVLRATCTFTKIFTNFFLILIYLE